MGGSTTPGVQESPLQQSQAKVASEQWQDYQRRWVPVQSFYIGRTQGDLNAKKALAEGGANADIQQQYGKAGQQLDASLESRGSGAGSNKDIFAKAGLSLDKAAGQSAAQTTADAAVQRQYESALQDIVGMGRGQKASSNQSLESLADLSGERATASAQAAEQEAAGLGQAVGTVVGTPGGWGLGAALNQPSQSQPQGLT